MRFFLLFSFFFSGSLLIAADLAPCPLDRPEWSAELLERVFQEHVDGDDFFGECVLPTRVPPYYELEEERFPSSVRGLIRRENRRRFLRFPKEQNDQPA